MFPHLRGRKAPQRMERPPLGTIKRAEILFSFPEGVAALRSRCATLLPYPTKRRRRLLLGDVAHLPSFHRYSPMKTILDQRWTAQSRLRSFPFRTATLGRSDVENRSVDTGGAFFDAAVPRARLESEGTSQSLHLTEEQAAVRDLACQGASLFVGGEAGTGKSHLLRAMAATLQAQGRRVLVTASTGIAALNIGGETFHSTFGVPLPTPDDLIDSSWSPAPQEGDRSRFNKSGSCNASSDACRDDRSSHSHERSRFHASKPFRPLRFNHIEALSTADVVIIDEVSLLHAGFLETFERVARRAPGRNHCLPFGGLQMILSGDFLQLSPFTADRLRHPQHSNAEDRKFSNASEGDRLVCQRVLPAQSADVGGEAHVLPLTPPAVNAVNAVAQGSPHSQWLEVTSQKSHVPTARLKPRRFPSRRRRDLWYYDKPLFLGWCFCHYLLHVQLQEPQRQQDAPFAAALNQLRRGALPYCISRSASLNAPDDHAIRLLPTKAAVKNFNDRKMLELEGEEKLFRTQLTMKDAVHIPTTPGEPMRDTRTGEREDMYGATLVLYYRLHAVGEGTAEPTKRRGRLSTAEAWSVARRLEDLALLPRGSVQVHEMPAALSYSTALCTACVRCFGSRASEAERRCARVKKLLELGAALPIPHMGNSEVIGPSRTHEVPSFSPAGWRPTCGPLFPRELIRVEAIEWLQLLRRLQPTMEEGLRNSIQRDTILQDKRLKVGCRVMLLRNLTHHYVNGSLGTVTRFQQLCDCADLLPPDAKASMAATRLVSQTDAAAARGHFIEDLRRTLLPVVRMDRDGRDVAIPWITLPASVVRPRWRYTLRAACIPLTPAYAFTVHKIQGVTLDHPMLFDADGMFPCDHLVYVAASRVRKFEQLRIINLSPRMISVHKPALEFTARVPTVKEAVQTWNAWRSSASSSSLFFLPSYLGPVTR